MIPLHQRLSRVRADIAAACVTNGRSPQDVRLIAVSKTFDARAVREAAAAGQTDFGENYVQEALAKIEATRALQLTWHFIGPIQSNKTRDLAEQFDWAHSVDRFKIAQRLSEQRPADQAPLNVCVQVNVSGEASKSGCAPTDALELCRAVATQSRLRLRGLMAIPAPGSNRAVFQTLRTLFESIRQSDVGMNAEFDTLSAGMSDDFPLAIAEGATMIRVGSAIFGSRN